MSHSEHLPVRIAKKDDYSQQKTNAESILTATKTENRNLWLHLLNQQSGFNNDVLPNYLRHRKKVFTFILLVLMIINIGLVAYYFKYL